MSRTYSLRTCFYCKRQITAAGAAFVSHMRKHVREGLVTEKVSYDEHYNKHIEFIQVKEPS